MTKLYLICQWICLPILTPFGVLFCWSSLKYNFKTSLSISNKPIWFYDLPIILSKDGKTQNYLKPVMSRKWDYVYKNFSNKDISSYFLFLQKVRPKVYAQLQLVITKSENEALKNQNLFQTKQIEKLKSKNNLKNKL